MDPEHAATGCVESVQNKAVSNRSKKRSKGKRTGRAPSAGEVEKINWRVQSEGKGLDLSWASSILFGSGSSTTTAVAEE